MGNSLQQRPPFGRARSQKRLALVQRVACPSSFSATATVLQSPQRSAHGQALVPQVAPGAPTFARRCAAAFDGLASARSTRWAFATPLKRPQASALGESLPVEGNLKVIDQAAARRASLQGKRSRSPAGTHPATPSHAPSIGTRARIALRAQQRGCRTACRPLKNRCRPSGVEQLVATAATAFPPPTFPRAAGA